MPILVNCTFCKKEFKVKPGRLAQGRGRFCSNKCNLFARKNGDYKTCETCGKKFYLNKSQIMSGKGRYCSNPCRYKNTSEIRACLNCNKCFNITKNNLEKGRGKYCSQHCSNEARKKRITKICIVCDKTFVVQQCRANISKYCSRKCRYPKIKNLFISEKSKKGSFINCLKCRKLFYRLPSRKDKKYCSKDCMKSELSSCTNPSCKKKYYIEPSTLRKGHGYYCSQKCRMEHLKTKLNLKCLNPSCNKILLLSKYEIKKNIHRYCSEKCKPSKTTGNTLKCSKCGKYFYCTPIQFTTRKHCSMKCFRTGNLTPLHKKIRHLSYYFSWRNTIFQRDKYTCRTCGKKGGYLEAHHIKDFKQIKIQFNIQTLDDAIKCKELWDINNGMTLCKLCHIETKSYGVKKHNDIADTNKQKTNLHFKN